MAWSPLGPRPLRQSRLLRLAAGLARAALGLALALALACTPTAILAARTVPAEAARLTGSLSPAGPPGVAPGPRPPVPVALAGRGAATGVSAAPGSSGPSILSPCFGAAVLMAGAWLLASARRSVRQERPSKEAGEFITVAVAAEEASSGEVDAAKEAPHVVVVGAGVAGLCTAGRLLRAGLRVTLVEQNGPEACGGRLWTERMGQFRFEVGASLLLLPDVYAETFVALGFAQPFDEVVGGLRRLQPAYGVFFDRPAWDADAATATGPPSPNPRKVALGAAGGDPGWEALVERAGAAAAVAGYGRHAQAMLDAGFPLFIDGDVGAALAPGPEAAAARAALARGLRALPPFLAAAVSSGGNPFAPHAAAVAARLPPTAAPPGPVAGHAAREVAPSAAVARRMVRAALTFQDLYVGLSPATAPNVFSLLHAIELGPRDGIYYPLGGEGFAAVSAALSRHVLCHPCLQEAAFRTRCIGLADDLVDPARVGGVVVTGEDGQRRTIWADAVVVSADRAAMAPLLEADEADARRMAAAAYSSSSVTFLFGLRPAAADRVHAVLEHHNVFLSEPTMEGETDDGGYYGAAGWAASLPADGRPAAFPVPPAGGPPARFPFYLCCASKTDPTAATNGGATLMVLVPVPSLPDGEPDASSAETEAAVVAAARAGVVRALVEDARAFGSAAAFEAAVEVERVVPPAEWRARFGLRRGAVFGLSHGLTQLGPFRPGLRSRRAANLFYCGASAQPGNGVPLVMVSAKKVSRLVIAAVQPSPSSQ